MGFVHKYCVFNFAVWTERAKEGEMDGWNAKVFRFCGCLSLLPSSFGSHDGGHFYVLKRQHQLHSSRLVCASDVSCRKNQSIFSITSVENILINAPL